MKTKQQINNRKLELIESRDRFISLAKKEKNSKQIIRFINTLFKEKLMELDWVINKY